MIPAFSDLDRMVNWSKTWQMIFSTLKCYVLKITKKKKTVDFDYNINGQTLQTVASNPYLGAELTNTMSWDKQVGTPDVTLAVLDLSPSMVTCCSRCMSHASSYDRMFPFMPYDSSFFSRRLCGTVVRVV
jgi:hypothetical protein